MFLQNKACSIVAVAGSGSSSIPSEFSPPRVAATMSGRSGGASLVLMIQCYPAWRKKISNRTISLPLMIMVVASLPPNGPVQGPLEGEDIETEHWEDARHWISIYDDLIRFKLGLLERVNRELPKLHPVAQKAADVDVAFIETQMTGYYERLDLWYQRIWA